MRTITLNRCLVSWIPAPSVTVGEPEAPVKPMAHHTREPATAEGKIYSKWIELAGMAIQLIKRAESPNDFDSTTFADADFATVADPLHTLFRAAAVLVRGGRSSGNWWENEAAERLDERLQELCFSLMGRWFTDWTEARGAFLVRLRELLAEKEGQYALIGRSPETGEWDVMDVKPTASEVAQAARERSLENQQVFIERIVKGAERVKKLDLCRADRRK